MGHLFFLELFYFIMFQIFLIEATIRYQIRIKIDFIKVLCLFMLKAIQRVSFRRLLLLRSFQFNVFSAVWRDKKIFTPTLTISSHTHILRCRADTYITRTHTPTLEVTKSSSEVMSKVSALIQWNHSKGFSLSEPHHMRVTLSSNFAGYPFPPPASHPLPTLSLYFLSPRLTLKLPGNWLVARAMLPRPLPRPRPLPVQAPVSPNYSAAKRLLNVLLFYYHRWAL